MRPIDLPPADLETVRRILRDHAPGLEARAFGSRVSWTARDTSDLDLVLMTESPLDAGRMAALRAALAGSDLPFRVDVADWAAVSEGFRAIIEREYAVLSSVEPARERRGWPTVEIGEIADIVGGGTPSTKDPANFDGDIPWLTPRDLSAPHGRVVTGGKRNLSRAGLSNSSAKLVPPGAVLLSTRAPVGYVAIAGTEIATNQGFRNLVVREGACPEFVFYWLNANTEELERHATGTTFRELSGAALKRIRIPFPTLPEQRAIAEILGALDDKIELNRRMNETLEAMARAVFDDWFVDFGPTHAKIEGREPYLAPEVWRLFPDRLVDTEFGQIPRGWNLTTFGDVANMTSGRSYKSSELAESEAALVTLKSFSRDGGYRPDGLKPYIGKFKNGQIIRQGEVVVACTDITQAADVVGRPAVVHSSSIYKTLIASLDMVIVRPTAEIGRGFIYFLCISHKFTRHCLAYTTGTTVLHLDKKAIPIFKFACPPSNLLDKFGAIAEDAIDRVVANSVENEALAMLRDLLLPRLMSGRVRVSNIEKAAA